ncbi:DUF916 domain-containing protein [Alkalibacillus aidingensis]|uniref:DUF916 domain-containing protein n=1 Tax=Alkalibacillus aidingensis TaxID=2747607 RepID=UPI00166045D7|nr:DUF916 domain-containing protein [Alkalibacillus aidingensis]
MKFRVVIVLFFIIHLIPYSVFSDPAEQTPISLEVTYPENQVKGTTGYFDLMVDPGDEQVLELEVTNNLENEITIMMESANAYTHPSGGITYGQDIQSPNMTLLDDGIRLSDFMTVPQEVQLDPLSTETVSFEISVPELDGGTLLGAIRVIIPSQEDDDFEELGEDEAQFIIDTETVYTIATQLNLPEEVDSNLTIGETDFTTDTGNVYVELINDAHKLQDGVHGEYFVSNENGEELFDGEFGRLLMAPKSQVRHVFPWDYEAIEEGTYTVDIQATADNQEELSVTRNFTIGGEDIEEYVERTDHPVNVQLNQGMPVWGWILIILLAGGVFYFLGRRRG